MLFFVWLGKFISGDVVKGLLQGYTAKLQATNTTQKIDADLQQGIDQIQANVVIAEENKWFPFVRWGFAFPYVIFNMKTIVWDRMMHLGHTDELSVSQIAIEITIIGAYFGHSAIQAAARKKA